MNFYYYNYFYYYLQHLRSFFIGHARRISKLQTFIRSRDSPLNIQSSILAVFIDAIMPVLELTNGQVENVSRANKTQKILLLIMHVVFLKYVFVENFNIHPGHTSLFLETVTIKFWGSRKTNTQELSSFQSIKHIR